MDIDRIASIVRAYASSPSRRAVSRALVGITAGSVLTPLLELVSGEAKKKGKGKKKKKKKKTPAPACPSGRSLCPADGQCCQDTRCHEKCGCCPESAPSCCTGTGNAFCYNPNEEQCCPAAEAGIAGACKKGAICGPSLGGLRFCCTSGDEVCRGGCCTQGTFCCSDDGVCCDNLACQPAPAGTCFPQDLGIPARTS